jgi:hypothetical protein
MPVPKIWNGSAWVKVPSVKGDMLKSIYDTDGDGVIENAQTVNHHTILSDVPADAVFTDTVYTHPAEHAISVITGLQTALNGKEPATTVMTDLASTTYTIATAATKTEYVLGTITALTISAYPAGSYEFFVSFTADTGITVSLPAGTKWLNGSAPVWTATKVYELHVKNGRANAGEYA